MLRCPSTRHVVEVHGDVFWGTTSVAVGTGLCLPTPGGGVPGAFGPRPKKQAGTFFQKAGRHYPPPGGGVGLGFRRPPRTPTGDPKNSKTHNFGQFSHKITPYTPKIGLCTLFTACRTLPNPFFNKICPSKSILKPYEKKFFQGPRGRQALQTLPPPGGGGRLFDPIFPKTKKAGRHPPPGVG